jgi:hypothetical protein
LGQEDYLKRQFDQLGRALGRILTNLLALKAERDASEVFEITNHALKKELDMDIDQLLAIPHDQFIDLFRNQEGLNNKHLEKLGDIFYQLADLISRQHLNKMQSRALYERTSVIYDFLNTTGSVYSLQRQFLINRIQKMLREN